MVVMASPRMQAIRPFRGWLPPSTATAESPQITSIRKAGEPKPMTMGRITGRVAVNTMAPNSAPRAEAAKAAPKARLASPFWAMG
jgi:hypothetical protein